MSYVGLLQAWDYLLIIEELSYTWGRLGFDVLVEDEVANRGFRWPLKKTETL